MAEQTQSALDMFYKWEKERPGRVYLRQPVNGEWNEYTWGRVADESRRMAAALQKLGIEPGDRVALVSKNCAHWLMADFAIMLTGAISVPLYPNQKAETTRYVLEHSESKLIFTGKLDDPDLIAAGIPDSVKTIGFPYPESDGIIKGTDYLWDDLIKKNKPVKGKRSHSLDDVLTYVYTSGTTGFPKGVIQTYGAAAFATVRGNNLFGIGEHDRFISFLPLSHVAERFMVEMGSLYGCTRISFVESMDTFARDVVAVQPTVFFAVPRLWVKFQMGILEKMPQNKLDLLLKVPLLNRVIKKKLVEALGLNKARRLISGAAPLAPSVMDWFDRLGLEILEGYGLTENFAYGTINIPEKRLKGSVGVSLPDSELRISDEGEIQFKSPSVMKGYYLEPEKTAEAFTTDGWLKTGDRGKIDENGFITITGRVKEIFKTTKGKYVAPAPIENLMSENTNIEQICVMGTNLPNPVALLVPSEAAREKPRDELMKDFRATLDRVNAKLDHHEKMKKVIVVKDEWTVEEGMMTPTLKIKRNAVEDQYQNLVEASYDDADAVIWEN